MGNTAEDLGIGTEFGSQIEDVEAIDRYMRTIHLNTPEAFSIKDSYIRWYDNASDFSKRFSDDFYDEQRTRRNQLNIANQPTEQKKEEIRGVISRGIETEEMKGGSKPAIDPKTGRVGSQVTKPTVAPTPSTMPDPGTPSGPSPIEPGKVYPTIKQGSSGAEVKVWQTVIGVTPDGKFGPGTAAATKKWQSDHGLTPDGVVGPKSWAAAGAGPGGGLAPAVAPPPPFAPSVGPKPTFKPEPKPPSPTAPKAPEPKTAKVREKAKKAAVATASFFDVSSWPTWGKVVAGLTAASGVLALVMGKRPKFH